MNVIEVPVSIMLQKFIQGNWHLMLWGYKMPITPPPDSLWAYRTPNLFFYSNSDYDYYVDNTPPPANAQDAQRVFGESIGSIPIWSE